MSSFIKFRWAPVVALVFGLLLASQARAASLDPALQALVDAGDVDGVAAQLANVIGQGAGANDINGLIQAVSRRNPDIAGAVVNATVRNLAATGQGVAQISSTVQSLVSGALSGLSGAIAPQDVAVYAENVATNVRQVVAVVAGGNKVVANNLLASARSGVAQSASGGESGGAAAILRSGVSVRLAGSLEPAETEQARQQEPVVVNRQPTLGQQPILQPTQAEEPDPVVPEVPVPQREENPERDVISPS